jgi:hypothetical protein
MPKAPETMFVSDEAIATMTARIAEAKIPHSVETLAAIGVMFFMHLNKNVPKEAHDVVITQIKRIVEVSHYVPFELN